MPNPSHQTPPIASFPIAPSIIHYKIPSHQTCFPYFFPSSPQEPHLHLHLAINHIMNSNYFTLSPPSGDDYIGTESCMDLQNDIDVEHCDCDTSSKTKGSALKSSSKKKEKREFPPPIPLLSGTQNVPWVLKRYVTSDGRLILKEEKVKRYEYFRAHRSNGRLALQLVPLDEEEEGGVVDEESSDHSVINNSTDVHDESSVDELPMESDKGAVGGAHGGSKCLNCNGVRSSSCVFGVPMHPVRTVHG